MFITGLKLRKIVEVFTNYKFESISNLQDFGTILGYWIKNMQICMKKKPITPCLDVGSELGVTELEWYIFNTTCLDALECDLRI